MVTFSRPFATRARVAELLEEARSYTLRLLAPLPDDKLVRQRSPLQSPLVWDLAHIGYYEELWLIRATGAGSASDPRMDHLYDAFRHARSERAGLDLLGPRQARGFVDAVRGRVLKHLDATEPNDDPLLAGWFVYGLVIQHELQHNETMCQSLQIADDVAYPVPMATVNDGQGNLGGEVSVPAGAYAVGASDDPWAYDNERAAHTVELQAFAIDVTRVTNRRFLEFMDDEGYARRSAWSEPGRAWLEQCRASAPLYWTRLGDGSWGRRRFGHIEPLPLDEPVQHVSWFEADAFARWAGRRLATEAEGKWPQPTLVGRAAVRATM
jgi:gamma-glutamyl hercynylcysteine S-oxide synthase